MIQGKANGLRQTAQQAIRQRCEAASPESRDNEKIIRLDSGPALWASRNDTYFFPIPCSRSFVSVVVGVIASGSIFR